MRVVGVEEGVVDIKDIWKKEFVYWRMELELFWFWFFYFEYFGEKERMGNYFLGGKFGKKINRGNMKFKLRYYDFLIEFNVLGKLGLYFVFFWFGRVELWMINYIRVECYVI